MYFESLHAMWHMQGHGVYVWTVYVLSMALIAGLIAYFFISERRLIKAIRQHASKREEE